jgi:hypothetical protein
VVLCAVGEIAPTPGGLSRALPTTASQHSHPSGPVPSYSAAATSEVTRDTPQCLRGGKVLRGGSPHKRMSHSNRSHPDPAPRSFQSQSCVTSPRSGARCR